MFNNSSRDRQFGLPFGSVHLITAFIVLATLSTPAFAGDEPKHLEEVEQAYLDQLRECVEVMRERLEEDESDDEARFELARCLYFIGLTGENEATKEAASHLDRLLEGVEADSDEAEHARYWVYRGSCKTLEAARTWAFWKKQALADQGLAMIDHAVEASPDHAEVRFIRAATTYNLPFWFERAEQSADDFAKLAEQITEEPDREDLLPWMAAAALYHHAVIQLDQEREDEAREALELAVEIAPDSPAGVTAREKLQEME